jgi:hypothetical protein
VYKDQFIKGEKMKNITIRLFKKIILGCLFVFPITNIYADTSALLQERQRVINQIAQGQQRVNQYQSEYNAKLEAERKNREYQQKLSTTRKNTNRAEIPTEQQINKLGDLMTSDAAKNAVNYLDNLKPDSYQSRQVEPVEMNGFDNNLYGQRDSEV